MLLLWSGKDMIYSRELARTDTHLSLPLVAVLDLTRNGRWNMINYSSFLQLNSSPNLLILFSDFVAEKSLGAKDDLRPLRRWILSRSSYIVHCIGVFSMASGQERSTDRIESDIQQKDSILKALNTGTIDAANVATQKLTTTTAPPQVSLVPRLAS